MAWPVSLASAPGLAVGYSVKRTADGLYLDHADGTYKAAGSVATPVKDLPEAAESWLAGVYEDTIASTPQAEWPDGAYLTRYHDRNASDAVIGQSMGVMFGGDAQPAPPGVVNLTPSDQAAIAAAVAAQIDPWATALPGLYAAGTAGHIVGTYLDAAISAVPTAAEVAAAVWDEPHAGHATPGSMALCFTAVVLAPAGLDRVPIGDGNAREAMEHVAGMAAGQVSGATAEGGNITVGRLGSGATIATLGSDAYGNRATVVLATIPVPAADPNTPGA